MQPTAGLRLGAAFSYLESSAGTKAYAANHTALHALQGSLYGSWTGPHAFVDEVVTYGLDVVESSRAGVVSRLHGLTVGGTVSTETEAGYLVDWGALRIGPIADLAYTHVVIGGYSETGDSLLALNVHRQTLDAVTAEAGLQLRTGPLMAAWLSATFDVTADHDVFGDGRILTTAQTYAPTVLIRTVADAAADTLYGRLKGTLHAELAAGFSADLSGTTTFARSSGDSYGVDARLAYHF